MLAREQIISRMYWLRNQLRNANYDGHYITETHTPIHIRTMIDRLDDEWLECFIRDVPDLNVKNVVIIEMMKICNKLYMYLLSQDKIFTSPWSDY